MKRVLDLTVASLLFLFLSPTILLIAILVQVNLGSPVFFQQIRTGYGKKPFSIMKFRSMTNERDEKGDLLAEELRLTPFGQFLRKTSLDELPQLWNVIKGDMSLIGPRPLLLRYDPYYTEEENMRFSIRPGITGWAQIHGRNFLSWDEKLKLDVWYVENRTLLIDMKILFATLKKVIRSEGVADKPFELVDFDEERKNKRM